MLSGAIKIGGVAVDDLLVENLSDGISYKLLKGLAGMAVGGTGEGAEEVLSEVISRFGQWITYMDDKTFTEMLLSGDAREAYMDSFIGGFLLGIPSGAARVISTKDDSDTSKATREGPVQERTADLEVTQPQAAAPAETGRPTTASRTGGAPRRVRMGEPVDLVGNDTKSRSAEMTTDTDASVPDRTDVQKTVEQQPMRYEDALKAYVQGDTRFSAKPNVQTGSPDATTDAAPTAGSDLPQETAPKPKDQVIAELAPKLQKPGTTPGRATIAAQEMYAEAEKWYGSNADTVLEMFQPGQDPSKFLDGFRNAYIAGKLGDKAALENSSVAAYLLENQRVAAFRLGRVEGVEKQIVMSFGTGADTGAISDRNDGWLETLRRSQHPGKREMFQKGGDQKRNLRPISQKDFMI